MDNLKMVSPIPKEFLDWLIERARPVTNDGKNILHWNFLPLGKENLGFYGKNPIDISSEQVIEEFLKEHPEHRSLIGTIRQQEKEEELANVDMGIKIFLPVAVIVALLSVIGFYHVLGWIF